MLRDVLPVQRPEGYDRRWWVLAVLCLSLLIIGIDNTILNVALPTLSRTLHATNSQLQWIVDAYVLVFASLLLTTGSLSDRFGRRSAVPGCGDRLRHRPGDRVDHGVAASREGVGRLGHERHHPSGRGRP